MYVTKQEIESIEFAIENVKDNSAIEGLKRLLRKVKRERIRHDNNDSTKSIENKIKPKNKTAWAVTHILDVK